MVKMSREIAQHNLSFAGEEARLGVGASEVTLGNPAVELDEPQDFLIELEAGWSKKFAGTLGSIEIYHGDSRLVELDLPKFGFIRVNMPIRKVRLPTKLNFFFTFKSLGARLESNPSSEVLQRCLLVRLTSEPQPLSWSASRVEIVRNSVDTADRLGLRHTYAFGDGRSAFQSLVLSAIDKRVPYSVIRLGDGEGRILGYPDFFSEQEMLTQILSYHFGPQAILQLRSQHGRGWIHKSALELRSILDRACKGSDNIGLPVYDFFGKYEKRITSGMLGYACAMYHGLGYLSLDPNFIPIGTNIFQQLAQSTNFFRRVVEAANRVILIGPWDLTDRFSRTYGATDVQYIEVPRHYTWGQDDGEGQYPFLYKLVESRINKLGSLRGSVILIGAGIFGKHYCNLCKQMGGVALDIGSVMDSWAGKGLPYAIKNGEKIKLVD